MQGKIDEIGIGIYRLSIFVPEVAAPAGFTFNHLLVLGDEPLLFHCGRRKMFPLVSEAVAKIIPVEKLRWLTFGHFESVRVDE
jgi:flavorubredoxin